MEKVYIVTRKSGKSEEPIAVYKSLESALSFKNKKFRKVSFNVFPYIYQIEEGEKSFYIYILEVEK